MRVGIIVDNPARDLEGLALLAAKLTKLEHSVFMIPMYNQGLEVPALGLDAVVLNYARQTNTHLIKSYHEAGIQVIILDTEGGVWESEEQFVQSVNHKELHSKITKYLLWGERQKRAFLNSTNFTENQLELTGCPRYDFYHPSFVESIREFKETEKKHILIISNFALSNPKFGSSEHEVQALTRVGYSKEYAYERLADDRKNRKILTQTIHDLAKDFPEKRIIVRAHPFEKDEDYEQAFKNLSNVEVNAKGVVSSWLKSAFACIHCNSSVAIDAYMMKRPMFTLEWASSELTREMAEMSYDLSYPATSYENLRQKVNEAANDSTFWENHQPKTDAIKHLHSWFHPCDGMAAERAAIAIDSLSEKTPKLSSAAYLSLAKHSSKGKNSKIGKIDFWGARVIGAKTYNYIRQKYLNPNATSGSRLNKRFTVEDIQSVLTRILKSTKQENIMTAKVASKQDYIIPGIGAEAIKIELQ